MTWCHELNRAGKLILVHLRDRITTSPESGVIVWEDTDALPDLLKEYLASIPVWVDLTWAERDEQQDLNNVEYKKQVNAIVARFRRKLQGNE